MTSPDERIKELEHTLTLLANPARYAKPDSATAQWVMKIACEGLRYCPCCGRKIP